MAVWLEALPALPSTLVLIYARDKGLVLLEGLGQLENPVNSSGIEPAMSPTG
jgi:hypothetical protein